jgi:hypothetical protein
VGWESTSTFPLLIITSINPQTGLFVYSGAPAAGDLIASITAAGGTDLFGNATLSRLASYDPASLTAVALAGGVLNFYTAPSEAGPWTQVAQIATGSGDLVLASNRNIVAQQQLLALSGLQVTAGGADQVILTGAKATGLILDVTDTLSTTVNPVLRITAQAAGDNALSVRVAGDTASRFRVDSNAVLHAGPGSAALDTVLGRSAAALWFADGIAANVGGAAETFHTVVFANSWAQAAGRANTAYRLICQPNEMELIGSVTVPVGFAAAQNMTTAAAAAYQPTHTQSLTGWDTTTNLAVRLNWQTGGILQFSGPVANTAAGHIIDIPAQRVHLTD